jgi:hypothetical protein
VRLGGKWQLQIRLTAPRQPYLFCPVLHRARRTCLRAFLQGVCVGAADGWVCSLAGRGDLTCWVAGWVSGWVSAHPVLARARLVTWLRGCSGGAEGASGARRGLREAGWQVGAWQPCLFAPSCPRPAPCTLFWPVRTSWARDKLHPCSRKFCSVHGHAYFAFAFSYTPTFQAWRSQPRSSESHAGRVRWTGPAATTDFGRWASFFSSSHILQM